MSIFFVYRKARAEEREPKPGEVYTEVKGSYRHGYGCPHFTGTESWYEKPAEDCNSECGPLVKVESYVGRVLATRERNGPQDSDFYAVVWDGTKITSVEYATTRFGGGGYAGVDLTEETKAAARAWLYEWAVSAVRFYSRGEATARKEGREAIVVSGRKVPPGTIGTIKRIVDGRYPAYAPRKRVLLVTEELGEVWTDLRNVEVTSCPIPSEEEIRERAAIYVRGDPWHYPVALGTGYVVVN